MVLQGDDATDLRPCTLDMNHGSLSGLKKRGIFLIYAGFDVLDETPIMFQNTNTFHILRILHGRLSWFVMVFVLIIETNSGSKHMKFSGFYVQSKSSNRNEDQIFP